VVVAVSDRGRLRRRDPGADTPLDHGLFALLLVLIGLLDVLAAGSKFLIGAFRGGVDDWLFSTGMLGLIGLCYFALARGVLGLRSWVAPFAGLLTLLVLAFGLLRYVRDDTLDLALASIFVLAVATNLGLLGWVQLPATRERMERADPTVRRSDA
jgi:hypothetical protein